MVTRRGRRVGASGRPHPWTYWWRKEKGTPCVPGSRASGISAAFSLRLLAGPSGGSNRSCVATLVAMWVYDSRTNKQFTLKQDPLSRSDLDDFVGSGTG